MASISIIIPVYNVAGYVRQCIMSVLEQVDERVEIIVVEDHSTDHSLEIVQELVSLNPDIRLLRPEENLGLGAARNLGISKASNEYVMFLDSDDFLVPGSVQRILDRCDESQADVIFFDYARLYWNNKKVRNMMGHLLSNQPDIIRLKDAPDLLKIINISCNKAYRTSYLAENDLHFATGYYEDVPFTYPALCLANSIAILDRVCLIYRQRRKGSILRSSNPRHLELIDQLDILLNRFENDPRLQEWLPTIWERAANHVVAVLAKGADRLPEENREEFFHGASAVLARHKPLNVDVPRNARGLKYQLLVRDDYRAFQLLKQANAQKNKLRKKYEWRLKKRWRQGAALINRTQDVDQDLAVFSTMWGLAPRGNPLAIAEALATHVPSVKPVWALGKDAVEDVQGIDYVVMGTPEHKRLLTTAKWFINDVNFPNTLTKRPGQVHLQTQHGTPLKFIGLDVQGYPLAANHMSFGKLLWRIDYWDYNLSSSRYSTEILNRAFPGDHKILEYGYPRNDVLVNPPSTLAAETRTALGIPEDNLSILYTPTYRDGVTDFDPGFDPVKFVESLDDNVTLLIRSHHAYSAGSRVARLAREGRILDVSSLPEIAPLYLAADVLVCDYSSTMFDYANLARPIIIFGPDWEQYQRARGTYFDIMEEPPGATARSLAELVRVVRDREYESPAAKELLATFRARFCEFEDGRATERVVRRLFLDEPQEAVRPVNGDPSPLRTWNLERPG